MVYAEFLGIVCETVFANFKIQKPLINVAVRRMLGCESCLINLGQLFFNMIFAIKFLNNCKTMKTKFFICMILMTWSCVIQCQIRLGWSESQIRADLAGNKFESGINDSGNHYLFLIDKEYSFAYYFSKDGISNSNAMFNMTDDFLAMTIKTFNLKCVANSTTSWTMYSSDQVIDVKLIYEPSDTDGNKYVFLFTLKDF